MVVGKKLRVQLGSNKFNDFFSKVGIIFGASFLECKYSPTYIRTFFHNKIKFL